MVQIKLDLEKIFLIVFIAILLFIGPGALFNHKIQHDFPYAYSASDAFQHQVRAESIKDMGNFRYEASYISHGFEKTVGRYPPVIYHISVVFSYAAGLEVYDSIYFIAFFFAIMGISTIYIVIKDFNRNVALLSLPLAMLTFSHPTLIGFTWGHWPSLLGQFFLIAFAWAIMKIDLEKSYIIIGLIFASIVLSHTAAAIFAVIFLALFFIIKLLGKNLKKSHIKSLIIAFALSFIVVLHYLIIFRNTWAKAQPYSFAVQPIWEGNPGFYIAGFGILLVFIAIGVLFALFKLKNMHASLVLAFAMLLAGFMNYAGFEVRSFQIRFFWPIYLSVFFGFGIYILSKFAIKKWNMAYTVILSVIFVVLLAGLVKIPLIPQYNKIVSQGIMNQFHWSALQWLEKSTESDSKIYFFYGDIYNQDAVLRNSKRLHYLVDANDFVKAIQERKIKRYYATELPGDSGGNPAFRTGLFSFEDALKTKPSKYFFGSQDICNFNYLIFDKVSRTEALAQYNVIIASELLKRDYIEIAFENEVTVILKNSNIGADCIEERSF